MLPTCRYEFVRHDAPEPTKRECSSSSSGHCALPWRELLRLFSTSLATVLRPVYEKTWDAHMNAQLL